MKRFYDSPRSWSNKINYVDKHNKVIGFNMSSNCCEKFGHAVVKQLPTTFEDLEDYEGFNEDDLAPYSFVDEPYHTIDSNEYGSGGTIAFKIRAKGLPTLYVVIWNHHNGYYSHGFTTWLEKDGNL